jgi:hypothetical protein
LTVTDRCCCYLITSIDMEMLLLEFGLCIMREGLAHRSMHGTIVCGETWTPLLPSRLYISF